jgi:terminase small subunit / prophage DNA-packing protein
LLIDLDKPTTQRRFAKIIGVSEAAVSQMVARGLLDKDQSLGAWLLSYCEDIREKAAGRAAVGDLDLATERAALARASREKIDLQNAVTRKQLAPVSLIEEVLARAGARVAGVLDAVPGTIKRRFPDLPAEVRMVIKTEVAKARNIAAHMSPDDLVEDDDAVEKMAEGAD